MASPFKEFFHSAVRARDFQALSAWYSDVLGLPVTRRQPADEWGGEAVFFPGLQLVDGGEGLDHLGLLVEDMDAAIAHLEKHGVKMVTPIISRGPTVRVAFCLDPEGNKVELVERKG